MSESATPQPLSSSTTDASSSATEGASSDISVSSDAAQPAAARRRPSPLEPCLTPEEKAQLNWKQIGVLENLAQGLSISSAARLVQVSRNTVYRWLNCDPVICAAYNRWKRLCQQSAEARLLSLQETAIDVVAEQIVTKRDGKLACALLRSLGVLKPADIGPTSPALFKQQLETDRLQRRADAAKQQESAKSDAYYRKSDMVEDAEG